jgi:hypothetical protein
MKDTGTVRRKTEFAVLAVAPTMMEEQTPVAATAISLITSFGLVAYRIATITAQR